MIRVLRRGMRGADVGVVQDRLIQLGLLAGPADNSFGPLMEAAVMNFQRRSNLEVDGRIGTITYSMLTMDPTLPGDKVVECPRTVAQYAAKIRAARIRPEFMKTVTKRGELLRKFAENRYAPVARQALGISELWWVVALIHNQEAGSDVGVFKAVLHNGEKIVGTGRKTSLVPAGKGPFATWEEAAIDALMHDGANKQKQWDRGSALMFFEKYNGLGYRNRGVASPYVWAMTDQYTKGHFGEKVGADGKPHSTFFPNKVSQNYGCAAIMMALGVGA